MIKSIYILSTLLLSITLLWPITTLACGCGCSGSNCGGNQLFNQEQMTEAKVQCPVMKSWITLSEAAGSIEYNGTTYYFCCGGCKERFLKNPEQFISQS